jgi:hypothetical protein
MTFGAGLSSPTTPTHTPFGDLSIQLEQRSAKVERREDYRSTINPIGLVLLSNQGKRVR